MVNFLYCLCYLLKDNELYRRIKVHAGKEDFRLNEDEWQQLATLIDYTYENFTARLMMLANLSLIELRACYLIKLELTPSSMAQLLCRSRNAVSMIRKRLYFKITQTEGKAEELDALIRNF